MDTTSKQCSCEKLDAKKFHNSILFFVKFCNNSFLGKTKLNKLLYYLDFVSFRDRQTSVTGDVYISKTYGPVPEKIDEMLAELKKSEDIQIEPPSDDKKGFSFRLRTDPDLTVFDEYELSLLKKICDEFENWKTEKIVNQTHLEAPWFYSEPYDTVDYKYASNIDFFTNVAG